MFLEFGNIKNRMYYDEIILLDIMKIMQIVSFEKINCTFFFLVIGAARHPAKFRRECKSLWHINHILIKQRDNYSVVKQLTFIYFAGFLAAPPSVFILHKKYIYI